MFRAYYSTVIEDNCYFLVQFSLFSTYFVLNAILLTIYLARLSSMKESFAEIYTLMHTAGEVRPAKFQLSLLPGLFSVNISGLGNVQTNNALQRVMSALKMNAFNFPRQRIIGRLEPVEQEKFGTSYDLPLAILLLATSKQIQLKGSKTLICGEFDLTGKLCSVRGVLAGLSRAAEFGIVQAIVPASNYDEACLARELVPNLRIFGVSDLAQALEVLAGRDVKSPTTKCSIKCYEQRSQVVIGQEDAQLALRLAAAGNHPTLMIGSPGCGKSSLAQNTRYLLPALTGDVLAEVRKIYSFCGEMDEEVMFAGRAPFIDPHHSTTVAALIGGGSIPQPGLASKAHHGILFLDELCEFSPSVLASLREPLERKSIYLRRQRGEAEYPANFLLIAASNPCPCGFAFDQSRKCTCSRETINRYLQKIRGPLHDRIHITVLMESLKPSELLAIYQEHKEPDFNQLREQVAECRQLQIERNRRVTSLAHLLNADIPSRYLASICRLDIAAENTLNRLGYKNNFTARNFTCLLKVARTCADMDMSLNIQMNHVLLSAHFCRNLELER